MEQRPKILLTAGRINQPLQVPNSDLLQGNVVNTFIISDTAAGVNTLALKNTSGFDVTIYPFVIIGEIGNQGTELIPVTSVDNIGQITLSSATSFPHSSSTPVYAVLYDQVEFDEADDAQKTNITVLATSAVTPDLVNTIYFDLGGSSYYYARFVNSLGDPDPTFSPYSDPAPFDGYTLLSARSIIDAALGEINKKTSEVLTDEFAFQQIDACQTEVLRELKRWSFMQKFDAIVAQVATGSWKFTLPVDLDDQNTNKSVYQLRVGTQQRLTWVDKEKFDEFLVGVAYNTLASVLNVGDATVTLTDSSDFDDTGTIVIGAHSYGYSANNTSTGVLTLNSVVPANENQASGADVFQGATQGLPQYWTTYGRKVYYWPITASEYDGKNLYMDYYIKQTQIQRDSDEIIFPDQMVAVYYLCWKFLKKLSNGDDGAASQSYQASYLARREKMKQKETLGTTFKLRPRIQNFNIQSQFSEDTPRWIRDANFPNTGF